MRVVCTGGVSLFGTYQRCWISAHHRSHGVVDINHSIPWSCDVFYYTLAARLGIEKIAYWAIRFGIGQKTGIDLPDEMSGTMPSPEWKMKNYHQKWYPGRSHLRWHRPGRRRRHPHPTYSRHRRHHLRRRLQASPRRLSRRDQAARCPRSPSLTPILAPGNQTVPIAPRHWETVTDAMATVTEPGGTAGLSHLEGIDFAGKTGSAQTMSNALAAKLGHAHTVNDNAWFVGVSPRRNPDIAVVVLWEGRQRRLLLRSPRGARDRRLCGQAAPEESQPRRPATEENRSRRAVVQSRRPRIRIGGKPLPARTRPENKPRARLDPRRPLHRAGSEPQH